MRYNENNLTADNGERSFKNPVEVEHSKAIGTLCTYMRYGAFLNH